MNDKETKSVFEPYMVLYSYDEEGNPPQYPSFKVCISRMGIFSTLAKAEQAIKEWVDGYAKYEGKEEDEHVVVRHHYLFGFFIKEFSFDVCTCGWSQSRRNYLHDGSLLDECLTAEIDDRFLGRTSDRVRYHPGDLVEVLHDDGETVTLEMVVKPPMTPEEVNEFNLKNKDCKVGTILDASCDSYYTLSISGKKNKFSEPEVINVFPLRFQVSDDVGKQLETRYKNYLHGNTSLV
jgi:hypothetical protein